MAVRRFISGDSDFILCDVGDAVDINQGAATVAILVKKEADADYYPMIAAELTGGSARRSFWISSADNLYVDHGGFDRHISLSFEQTDGWAVIGFSRPAGSATVWRGHRGILGGAWSHVDGGDNSSDDSVSDVITKLRIGAHPGSGAYFQGLIAVIGIWLSELSDLDFESGLDEDLDSWVALSPDWLVRLDQASTSTPVEDLTTGGGDQTSIQGTSVVTGDDPPGFTFDSGPSPSEVTISPGSTTLTPVAVTPVAGEVTVTLSPGGMSFAPIGTTVIPGEVTAALPIGSIDFQSVPVEPLSAGSLMVSPGALDFQGIPFTFAHGAVTIGLSTSLLVFTPVDIGEPDAEVDLNVAIGPSRIGSMLVSPSRSNGMSVWPTREARGN